MSEHKTPRTDAVAWEDNQGRQWTDADFARTIETELADLRAKLDAARVAIEEAPHTENCNIEWKPGIGPCDCWKSTALAQIDTAISPPDTQSKNT